MRSARIPNSGPKLRTLIDREIRPLEDENQRAFPELGLDDCVADSSTSCDGPFAMVTWAELCASHSTIESAGSRHGVDWSTCQLEDLGESFLGPANFTGAIMRRFPSVIHSASGRMIGWTSLQQENTLAHKLLGGIYFVDEEFRKQLDQVITLHPWAKGHMAVVPPTLIAATVTWQERADDDERSRTSTGYPAAPSQHWDLALRTAR